MSNSLALKAFLTWLIPFVIAIPFFDQSGQLKINFWVFKLIMLVVLSLATYIVMRGHKYHGNWSKPFGYLLALNAILDSIVLMGLLKIPFSSWLLAILPVYILVFGAINYYLSTKSGHKRITK
jgi:hypothetical protein